MTDPEVIKAVVRKREYYQSHPWRGFFLGSYRDFDTQTEAFDWAAKKYTAFFLRTHS